MLQVNELIHQEVDRFLSSSFEPPAGVLFTIIEVHTAADLSTAKIFLSVLPAERGAEVLRELQTMAGTIRAALAGRLRLRTVPKLLFVRDEREERAARMNQLLDDEAEQG